MKSLDSHNYVISISSFTKIMFPGLKGRMDHCSPQVIQRLVEERRFTDIHTNTLSQYAIYEFCRNGLLSTHLGNLRRLYRQKRDIMISHLRKSCYSSMTWNKPEGGISLWCRLEKGMSSIDLLNECYFKKVTFVSGDNFFPDGKGGVERLNFSYENEKNISAGIRRLAKAITKLNPKEKAFAQPLC